MGDQAPGHEEVQIFLGAYVLGALQDDDRRAELEAHLERCGRCSEELSKLADVAARLAGNKEDPRPILLERIRARTSDQGRLE